MKGLGVRTEGTPSVGECRADRHNTGLSTPKPVSAGEEARRMQPRAKETDSSYGGEGRFVWPPLWDWGKKLENLINRKKWAISNKPGWTDLRWGGGESGDVLTRRAKGNRRFRAGAMRMLG